MPYFLSTVVVVGMFNTFLSSRGFVNLFLENMKLDPIMFMSKPEWFRTVYIFMGIWQSTGWSAIIYLAALSSIDPKIYEAAIIDGANKLKRIVYVTLPSIAPTISITLILATGGLLSVGFEKVYLMQNPGNISFSEVLATYIYRQGLYNNDMGYATAVGLFNSVVSFFFILLSNAIARRFSEYSIW